MEEIKKLVKPTDSTDSDKVKLYSTEGNSCSNAPYSANCSC